MRGSRVPVMLAVIEATRGSRPVSEEREPGRKGVVSDEALMRRVAEAGDERALSELYDRYGGMVYSMGLSYLRDRSLAEDLTQDVFASVWVKSESFDPSRASFSTWVYRISRNRLTDLDRRRRAHPGTTGSDPLVRIPVDDGADRIARSLDMAEALSRLSPEHRELLVLAYFEGLSQREIARLTDVPLGTVKTRTTAALRVLSKSSVLRREVNDG